MDEIHLVLRSNTRSPSFRAVPLERRTATGDESIAFAEIADFAFASGLAGGSDVRMLLRLSTSGVSMRRAMDARATAMVALALSGAGVRAGKGELNVGVVPLENAEAGQSSCSLDVVVSEE